jgi:hypothetical protein
VLVSLGLWLALLLVYPRGMVASAAIIVAGKCVEWPNVARSVAGEAGIVVFVAVMIAVIVACVARWLV